MSISLEAYFWLLDRLKIEDDPRNKVNMSKNQVALSKNFLKLCENGMYLGRLLMEMYPTYSKRVEKQFQLPQAVSEIGIDSPAFSQPVWKNIFEGLAQFGCKIEPAKQDQIVKTAKTDQVIELLECLYELDNSPNGQISVATKRKLGIKGSQPAKPMRNNESMSEKEQDTPGRNQKILGSITDRKGSAALNRGKKLLPLQDQLTSPRKSQVSPQNQQSLQKSPSVGALQSPNGKTPSRILGKEASLLIDLDVEQLDSLMPTSLEACRTSFQFIILSLSISFEMKPKQAAALLTNNNKYLFHLCVKGAKGEDFKRVKSWFELILPYCNQLINLIATEKKDALSILTPLMPISSKDSNLKQNRGKILIKTFNILKGGLYSKNQEIQVCCGQVFVQLFQVINETVPDMREDILEWLGTQTVKPEFKRKSTVTTSRDEISKNQVGQHLVGQSKKSIQRIEDDSEMKQAIGSKELEIFQFQTGIQAILFAYISNDEFIENAVQLMLQAGRVQSQQFFTYLLLTQAPSWSVYGTICCDTFRKSLGTQIGLEIIQESGILSFWIDQSLKIADSNSEVPLNDRIVSLVFMTEIWLARPQFFDKVLNNAADSIMRILKKGARDVRRTLCIISIELIFRLLLNLASDRHSYAPTIYKTLTFLLVEFYWEIDVRELMLRHFFDLFATFETIPINILCEPLFKQIGISQYHESSFNVFDFEFFNIVALHTKLTIQTALLLIDSLSKIALTSVFYQSYAISIINIVMKRYEGYQELADHWKESSRQVLATIVNMEARFAVHRHHLRQEENNFFNRLALRGKKGRQEIDPSGGRMSDQEFLLIKTNMRLAVNLLEKIIQNQNQAINTDLKSQLIDTFIGIQQGIKVDCKGIAYLLKYFTNKVEALVEERQLNNPQAAQQVAIPYIQELNQLKDKHSLSPGRGGSNDVYGSQGNLLQRKSSHPKLSPPALGVPVHHLERDFQVSVALPMNQGIKKPRLVDQSTLLYDYLKWEEEWEINQYKQFLKRHEKLYKIIHKTYVNGNAVKKPQVVAKNTFDDNEKIVEQITVASLLKFIKDFQLQNGVSPAVLKEEIIKLVKQININVLRQPGDIQTLNYEGFVNFILQYAHMQWQTDTQHKAYQVVEKLLKVLQESPMYQKLGLASNQIETTNRQDFQVLQAIQEKYKGDEDYKNPNFKVKEDQITQVQYLVPPNLPIADSKRIVVELLDEVLFRGLGIHFLEPITVQKTVKKVIPKLISHRKTSVNPPSHQNNKGILSNQPLSNKVVLSADQEEALQKFNKDQEQRKIQKEMRQYEKRTSLGNSSSVGEVDNRDRFKMQALDRRASQFGKAMQMTIIDVESLADKQTIFECASVLDEVLKAVEQGKKSLRLDFTPYKLYELRKRKIPNELQQIVVEDKQEEDEEEKQIKKQLVSQFLARNGAIFDQQKQKKAQEEEEKQIKLRKEEKLKQKIIQEYQKTVEETNNNGQIRRQEKFKQKLEEQEREQAEKEQRKQIASERLEDAVNKQKQHLQKLEAETQGRIQRDASKEERQKVKSKNIADKWLNIHKEKLVQVGQTKQQLRQEFYNVIQSNQIQALLNQKYSKGLYIKFDQAKKMSQTTNGITLSGWLEWLKQYGVTSKVNIKQLTQIHTSQIKEMHEIPEVMKCIQSDLKQADVLSSEKELNYCGFVLALTKVANLAKSKLREESEDNSEEPKEFQEYAPDLTDEDLKRFFKFIHVAGKSDK